MRRPHDPNGGRFRLPEPGLYLVLICDPYEEPSYDDICYVCDGDHLDGFVGRLHDAGFSPEDIHRLALRGQRTHRLGRDGPPGRIGNVVT